TYLEAYAGTDRSQTALAAWAAQRLGNSTLTELEYDARGSLLRRVYYAKVDAATGNGVLDDAAQVTRYVYDAQGLLRTQVTVRAGDRLAACSGNQAGDSVVDYVNDGMGALLDVVRIEGTTTFFNTVTDPDSLPDAASEVPRTRELGSYSQIRVVSDAGVVHVEAVRVPGRTA